MSVQRSEIPNFTHEQVVEHVRESLAIADECGLQGEERARLLPMIMEKLSSKQILMAEVPSMLQMPRPQG